ncbi:flavodoxin family protein [Faecalibacterium sp. An122]|uniref:flavodoxin family protein n=1 Tax=Faecalibacterium sp. An122 TaxID=1965551 RepID=UPI000B398659|nr:flavodoxin family protein [Faecalibacterium sp. An122]OUQ37976.1 flavodoxin [Faecalibacterium sp. An122]
MKTAICYLSFHHGNTLQVVQAMAREGAADLVDVRTRQAVHLEDYDCIGFASGIYGFEYHRAVVEFARQYLPQNKKVFFVCTYGGAKGSGSKALRALAAQRGCTVVGEFGCKGYDTFGPFKLVGGLAKGHPNAQDLERARAFFQQITRE